MLYTTLRLLREQDACSDGLSTLIASLPAKHSESEEISLAHILKSNGLEHAIWALRATTVDARKIAARMAIDFAYQVLDNFEKQFPEDKRPRTALETATAFLDGKITLAKLQAAQSAATHSAWSARSATHSARLAESAAWSAARSARSARSAARLAAWEAAWSAESAARSAAESAESAAWSAVQSEQKAIFRKWIRL